MAHGYRDWDVRAAYGDFERACALDPSDFDTRLQLGFFYVSMGDLSVALEHSTKLVELDPNNPIAAAMVGYVHMLDGRTDVGVQTILGAGLDANLPWHIIWVAWALAQVGRIEEAVAALARVEEGPELDFMTSLCLVWRAALQGDHHALAAAETPEFVGVSERDPAAAWFTAEAKAVVGDLDGAVDWLARSMKAGFINSPVLAETDALLGDVRGDPRFHDHLARVKDEWEAFRRDTGPSWTEGRH